MKVIGHRGSPVDRPENTLESFELALAQGADGIELDVRLSAEEELVVWHDPVIRRGAAEELAIHELAVSSLRCVDLTDATGHDSWSDPTHICTLAEVLDLAQGAIVDVELKNLPGEMLVDFEHKLSSLVMQLVNEADVAGSVVITSFWPEALDVVREIDPAIATGWLLIPGVSPLRVLEESASKGYGVLLPFDTSLDLDSEPEVFDRVREAGIETWTWTVNDPERMGALIDAGIDGIITDIPALAVEVLDR